MSRWCFVFAVVIAVVAGSRAEAAGESLQFSASGLASGQPRILVGIGGQLSYEKSSDGREFEPRTPLALRGGYRFSFADLYVEYSFFQVSGGESVVEVSRRHHEFLAWARRGFQVGWVAVPYVAIGAGTFRESIETDFNGGSAENTGRLEGLLSSALGLSIPTPGALSIEVEGRASYSPAYAESFVYGLGLIFGLAF